MQGGNRIILGVSIIDAFAPAGWSASIDGDNLTVTAPASAESAARKGSVIVVATGGNSLVLMTAAVALNILDVNGAYWDALIDDPQYGGDLLYGPMDPETYSYTLTESWMAGLPVIASDLGALKERISSTGGGWLVDYTNINGIYDLIININQKDYENKLSNISKIKFKDINEMCDEYITLYDKLTD